MNNYIWRYKFRIKHLLIESPVCDEAIEFHSPHFPSTEKDKDSTEGTVTISLNDLNTSAKEAVVNGLELIFALNTHLCFQMELGEIEKPPGLMSSRKCKIEAHMSYPLKEAENIPYLWNRYQKLIKNDHQSLSYAINWFMKAIKSEDPIDKFIYSWITFNMLYGWLTEVKGEEHLKGIKALTGKGIPSHQKQEEIVNRHKPILEGLLQLNLIDRDGIDRTERLRNSISGNNPKEILEGAIDTIGFIRHHIFHGSLKDRSIEAERCIWPLIHLDAEIIKHQLDRI